MVCSLLLIILFSVRRYPTEHCNVEGFMSAIGVPSIGSIEEPFASEFVLFVFVPDDLVSA